MLKFAFFCCIVAALLISGCATLPPPETLAPSGMPGIYHRVERGETLWRISRAYSIDLEELLSLNRITDASRIEVGQLIFVPQRKGAEAPAMPRAAALHGEDFIWPVKGKVVALFRQKSGNTVNKGLDILTRPGADIVASRSGTVVFCSPSFDGSGKTFIIDHGDGYFSVYSRSPEVLAGLGSPVKQGERIATMKAAQGGEKNAYFHFEIRKGHVPQNPFYYLPQ